MPSDAEPRTGRTVQLDVYEDTEQGQRHLDSSYRPAGCLGGHWTGTETPGQFLPSSWMSRSTPNRDRDTRTPLRLLRRPASMSASQLLCLMEDTDIINIPLQMPMRVIGPRLVLLYFSSFPLQKERHNTVYLRSGAQTPPCGKPRAQKQR
jgi:hypothetical protein